MWTPASKKRSHETDASSKIRRIRNAVVTVLNENPRGISLAQLPNYLKREINASLDLNELGFAKLKDLLATISDVTVEFRGTNHPFAVLRQHSAPSNPFNAQIKRVVDAMCSVIKEFPNGVTCTKFEQWLGTHLGRIVEWSEYGCESVVDFAKKYGRYVVKTLCRTDGGIVFVANEDGASAFTSSSNTSSYKSSRSPSPPMETEQTWAPSFFFTAHGKDLAEEFYAANIGEKVSHVSDLPAEFR